ncbi:MAG: TatD family hydrolase [Bacteroidales bacterium]|nr:TatD family hydrolase [Bacteroidales bacterium]
MGLTYIDIHTHQPELRAGVVAILNLLAGKTVSNQPADDQLFSVGLHPWHIEEAKLEEHFSDIEGLAKKKNCLAIGETGLDRLINVSMTLQKAVFERHIKIAANLSKPLIIHNVKAHAEISKMIKQARFEMPVIFHGFNNNRQNAGELLKNGFFLSFGKALLNPKSNAAQILGTFPADRFFLETDDSEIDIEPIFEKAAHLRNIDTNNLKTLIANNFKHCFG